MNKQRKFFNVLALLLVIAFVIPNSVYAISEEDNCNVTRFPSDSVSAFIESYMNARFAAITTGENTALNSVSTIGIVNDELKHSKILKEAGIKIVDFNYIISEISVGDTMATISLLENVVWDKSGIQKSSEISHKLLLMEAGKPETYCMLSDQYTEAFSEFSSASYIDPNELCAYSGGSPLCITTIAESQVGNVGGQPYWSWYGFSNRVEWCACFVSWCAHQANISTSIIPKYAGCGVGKNKFIEWGLFYDSPAYGGTYTPKAGDIFFMGDPNITSHTGIVISVSGTTMTVVDGNNGDSVRKYTINTTDTSFIGFGSPSYETSTHSYNWQTDLYSHWKQCDNCGTTQSSSAHTWVYRVSYYECSVCHMKATNIPSITSE